MLTRRADRCLFKSHRVYRGAECPANTDHYLVASEITLFPYKSSVKSNRIRRYDIERLASDESLQEAYSVAVQNRFSALGSLPEDPEECWTAVCSAIHTSAKDVIGYRRNKRKTWLSDASYDTLQEKCEAKLRGDDAQRRHLQAKFKRMAQHDKDAFLNKVATEAEEDARRGNIGSVFRAVRVISGKDTSSLMTPVNKSDGSTCTGDEEILERWHEHYDQALNHPSGTACPELDAASLSSIPSPDICTDEPTFDEVMRAIKKLKNGRAAGSDEIPPELLKCALSHTTRALHSLFQRVWRCGRVPAEWKDGIIVSLYKNKGPKDECGSYRPISLLSVPGKVFSHVLLERIQPLLQMTQRPQQSGFTAGRSTIDAVLALRLLSELHRQFSRPLYVAFVDIKSAFDSVDRNALWKALRARGIPDILLHLIEDLHTHTGATVRIGNKFSCRFATSIYL